jgi:hypothetical protein
LLLLLSFQVRQDFQISVPTADVAIPSSSVYLLIDIDRGKENVNLPPNKAIDLIKQANLGWCWDGNPHTWLGSASCKTRIGCS